MLALLFTIGFIAAGSTLIVRAVVPQHWLLVKPFACDLCMSFWSSLVAGAALGTLDGYSAARMFLAALGGVAVSVVLLKASNRLDVL